MNKIFIFASNDGIPNKDLVIFEKLLTVYTVWPFLYIKEYLWRKKTSQQYKRTQTALLDLYEYIFGFL